MHEAVGFWQIILVLQTALLQIAAALQDQYNQYTEVAYEVIGTLAAQQLKRFSRNGIASSLLDALFDVDSIQNHGMMRVRIIQNKIYIKKVQAMRTGKSTAWDDWNERQLHWLEGLLAVVETESIPDVDFIVGLSDVPYCELHPWGVNTPVFVFAQKEGCGNILVPDNSLMHDEYRLGVQGSPYYWRRLANAGTATQWASRKHGIVWDGDFEKPARRSLQRLRSLLAIEKQPLREQQQSANDTSVQHACRYKLSLDAEGYSYSMRLKNILFCGSVAVRYLPAPEARYEEYWVQLMEDFRDFIAVRAWDPDLAERDLRLSLALPDDALQQIAQNGHRLAVNVLRPELVLGYVSKLLRYYSLLQDFNVPTLHLSDGKDFTLLRPEHLADVRAYANTLNVEVFIFYFPEMESPAMESATSRGAVDSMEEADIFNVPCWGSIHRFLQCCSAHFNFYLRDYGDFDPEAPSETKLHSFCQRPSMKAGQVYDRCCSTTLENIVQVFRNSLTVYSQDEIMRTMDRSIQVLPIPLKHIVQLLEMLRNLAVQQALAWSRKASIEHDTADRAIARAWLHEETLQLATALLKIYRDDPPHPRGPRHFHIFNILQAEKLRIRSEYVQDSHQLVKRFSVSSTASVPVDVLLILADEENRAALNSLLANRQCALHIHLLKSNKTSHAWVEEVVTGKGMVDVSVQYHRPRRAVDRICKLVHGACDESFARFAPELWLQNVTTLVVLDFSSVEAGPLVLGDICALAEAANSTRGNRESFVYAARYEELNRFSIPLWSPTVVLMDLGGTSSGLARLGEMDVYLGDHKDAVQRARSLLRHWEEGAPSWKYAHLWLYALGMHSFEVLVTLPSSWYFVPYEPWLFDINWNNLFQIASMQNQWELIFKMREYPGFDGTSLRIACPAASMHVPVAMHKLVGLLGPEDNIVARVPDDLHTWRGAENCDTQVHVMGLQWARGHVQPVYPFKVRDSPWVQSLLARYE